MTIDRAVVIAMFALAAVLPILGISLAIVGTQRRKLKMRAGLAEIHRLHEEGLRALANGQATDYQARIDGITSSLGLPSATNSDVLALHLSIANTWTRLSWPGAIRDGSFVAIGLVLGAVASIWALFLPAW